MDIWDWLHGLKRWWWMLIALPALAAGTSWLLWATPEYHSSWTVNIVFDNPDVANDPAYFDFMFLDDLDQLLKSSTLGDVIYLRLPEDARDGLTRDEFGAMIHSTRRAREVEITISGDNQELISAVADTISVNLEDVMNTYMIPPTYSGGPGVINILTPISDPVLDTQSRMTGVAAVTVATFLVSLAATGVAEWLRMSYSAKYSAK